MNFLVALVLLLQEKTAEESFKKIEETITKSKTVRVKFDVTRKTGQETLEASGTLLLKEGNKARQELLVVYPGDIIVKQIIVSDGTNVIYTNAVGDDALALEKKKAPDHLLRCLTVTTLQLPQLDSSMMTNNSRDGLNDVSKYVSAREFKHGEGGKEGSLLLYKGLLDFTGRQKFANPALSFEVKLWYDPKTWIPRKREITMKIGGVSSTTTETYEEFVLDEDLPKEKFDLSALNAPDSGDDPAKKDK
jgi:outer membrane lipoprotein-sorting protein